MPDREATALLDNILGTVRRFDRTHMIRIAIVAESAASTHMLLTGMNHACHGMLESTTCSTVFDFARLVWTEQGKACGNVVIIGDEVLVWLAAITDAELTVSGAAQHGSNGRHLDNGTRGCPDRGAISSMDASEMDTRIKRAGGWGPELTRIVHRRMVAVFGPRPVVLVLESAAAHGRGLDGTGRSAAIGGYQLGDAASPASLRSPRGGDDRSAMPTASRPRISRDTARMCGCVAVLASPQDQDGIRNISANV